MDHDCCRFWWSSYVWWRIFSVELWSRCVVDLAKRYAQVNGEWNWAEFWFKFWCRLHLRSINKVADNVSIFDFNDVAFGTNYKSI